jgi:hypothetical protein
VGIWRALSVDVKWPGGEVTSHRYLPPSSRMRAAIPPLPPYVFIARCLVKYRDKFTFYLFTICEINSTQRNINYEWTRNLFTK